MTPICHIWVTLAAPTNTLVIFQLPIPAPGLQPGRTTYAALKPRKSTVTSAAVQAAQSEVIHQEIVQV